MAQRQSKSPTISVVMPVYNSAKYLPEAVESILGQSFVDIEFIIVDDCSTDNSVEIIQHYASQDSRIKLVRNDINMKIARTRNNGFAAMSPESKYVAIMDSDDVAHSQRFEKEFNFLEAHPDYSLVGCHTKIIDENSLQYTERKYPCSHEQIVKTLPRFNPFAQSSVMIRRENLEEVGYYDLKYTRCQDYDMWFRLTDKYKVANLDEFLLDYRVTSTQGKSTNLKETLKFTIDIQKKWIFKKDYFSLWNMAYMGMEYILSQLPNRLILLLFKNIRY